VTSIDVFAGYRRQDYVDPKLGSITGPTGGAKLTWNVTRLTTVTGSLTRDIQETVLTNSAGYFQTIGEVRVDHELLRNLLLNGSVGYEEDAFQGIGRTDDYYLTGAGAKYLIDHNFWLAGGYNFRNRSSNQTGSGFDEHIIFLRLSAHL
ncbi:MAG: outer membrane beta-barrel protein, partial [Mycobacterium sp.]